jgi:hypothetical protein
MKKVLVLMVMAGLILFSATLTVAKDDKEEPFLLSFVVGDYAIVGQYSDSSTAYSGVARIEKRKDGLALTRRIGPRTITADGWIEVPHPPAEGEVLRFRWIDKDPMLMTCLVNGDLDNYARLTCYVIPEGRKYIQPGVEAMFPTNTWPSNAPGKAHMDAAEKGK